MFIAYLSLFRITPMAIVPSYALSSVLKLWLYMKPYTMILAELIEY